MSDLPLVPADYHDDAPSESVQVETRQRLRPWQQLQIGCWIVWGHDNAKIQDLMAEQGFPAVTNHALNHYRYSAPHVLDDAKAFLRKNLMQVDLAEKAKRLHKLQRHAERLEGLMEETGLIEEHTKVLGFGQQFDSVTERRFAQGLSKEYRETLKDIGQIVDPVEKTTNNTQVNIFGNLSADDIAQFQAAIAWRPKALPGPIELVEEPEPVDGVVTFVEE